MLGRRGAGLGRRLRLLLSVGLLSACSPPSARSEPAAPSAPHLPWQSEPAAAPDVDSPLTALVGGTVMTGTGVELEDATLVFDDGRIVAVGPRTSVGVPDGARVIDVAGRFVTPGLIDAHSHMGVYPVPAIGAHSDGNEATRPVTANVRAADSFWPQDPALSRALASGVTTVLVLPGSANLVGGQGVTLKLHPGRSVDDMRFPGAPATLKMACGENPKRVYGERRTSPSTRMGNMAGYREAFQSARQYGAKFNDWQARHQGWQKKQSPGAPGGGAAGASDPAPSVPERDYGLETLLGAIEGRVLVEIHCYRADEMLAMLALADEFGFKVRAFHHAVEAYKIRDVLAARQVAVATWADWWGFKLEAFDTIRENLALLSASGVRGVLHSDSSSLVQRLNQEAAKSSSAGVRAGVPVERGVALSWITSNPAWVLGIDAQTGSLEAGKMADVVVWSRDPFSVYAQVERVFIDGIERYDATGAGRRPSDFELGQSAELPKREVPTPEPPPPVRPAAAPPAPASDGSSGAPSGSAGGSAAPVPAATPPASAPGGSAAPGEAPSGAPPPGHPAPSNAPPSGAAPAPPPSPPPPSPSPAGAPPAAAPGGPPAVVPPGTNTKKQQTSAQVRP